MPDAHEVSYYMALPGLESVEYGGLKQDLGRYSRFMLDMGVSKAK